MIEYNPIPVPFIEKPTLKIEIELDEKEIITRYTFDKYQGFNEIREKLKIELNFLLDILTNEKIGYEGLFYYIVGSGTNWRKNKIGERRNKERDVDI